MADTKKTDAVATTSPNQELAEIPSWIPEGDTTGTAMAAEDIRLPRLLIAQGLSPEIIPGNAKFIEGLSMFDLFNDLTQEIYGKMGKVSLTFIPVRHDVRRIEFKPRAEGGGVIDMNVPANDPRTLWTNDPEDPTNREKRKAPRATKFNEYIALLVREDGFEPIVISIKDTNKENRRAATNLNGYIGMPTKIGPKRVQLPIYGKMYTYEVGTASNDKGTYGVPIVKQAGVVRDEAMGKGAMKFLKSLEGKNVIIEREAGDDEFDAAALEAEAQAAREM